MADYEEDVPEEFEEFETGEDADYESDHDYDYESRPESPLSPSDDDCYNGGYYDDDDDAEFYREHRRYYYTGVAHRALLPVLRPSQLEAREQLINERRAFLMQIVGKLPDEYSELFEDEPTMAAINARVAKNHAEFMAKIQPGVYEDDGMGNAEMVKIIPKKLQK